MGNKFSLLMNHAHSTFRLNNKIMLYNKFRASVCKIYSENLMRWIIYSYARRYKRLFAKGIGGSSNWNNCRILVQSSHTQASFRINRNQTTLLNPPIKSQNYFWETINLSDPILRNCYTYSSAIRTKLLSQEVTLWSDCAPTAEKGPYLALVRIYTISVLF